MSTETALEDVIERPKFDVKKITLSSHYVHRIKERLPHLKDIRAYTIEALVKGSHQGIVINKDNNNNCHCFAYKDMLLHLSADDLRTVVTIYSTSEKNMAFSSSNEYQKNFNIKIKSFYNKEIRKLDRKANSLKKKLEEFNYIADVECSQLSLRKYKTRSKKVKMECEAAINDIRLKQNTYKSEIKEVEECKSRVIRASSSLDKFILSN